jgi:hypothetical protein
MEHHDVDVKIMFAELPEEQTAMTEAPAPSALDVGVGGMRQRAGTYGGERGDEASNRSPILQPASYPGQHRSASLGFDRQMMLLAAAKSLQGPGVNPALMGSWRSSTDNSHYGSRAAADLSGGGLQISRQNRVSAPPVADSHLARHLAAASSSTLPVEESSPPRQETMIGTGGQTASVGPHLEQATRRRAQRSASDGALRIETAQRTTGSGSSHSSPRSNDGVRIFRF